jgi:nuclear transport factor 2 (NTF2) superfamily protein
VDATEFQRWLDGYIAAWRSYDPAAIGALFAEDAEYRYHPWDEGAEVVVGRDAIVASWLEERDDPDAWSAEYRPWAIEGDRAVALGESRYLASDGSVEREYHNVFLCEFDDAGRCRSFTDVYLLRT